MKQKSEKAEPVKATPRKTVKPCHVLIGLLVLLILVGSFVQMGLVKKYNQLTHGYMQQTHSLQLASQAISAKFHQQQAELQQLQKQLTQQQQTVSHLAANHRDYSDEQDLYAAVYLIRLANFNLVLVKRPDIALHMLEQADFLLNQSFEPSFVPLRKLLNKHIIALKAANTYSLETVLLQLQALDDAIDKLPIAAISANSKGPQHILTNTKHATTWRAHVKQAWHEVGKLVIIRHHNQAIEPLLSPEQNAALVQTIHVLINQAQWAAMMRNDELFQHDILQLRRLIKRAYDEKLNDVQVVLSQLSDFSNTNVDPDLPDLSATFSLADKLINTLKPHA